MAIYIYTAHVKDGGGDVEVVAPRLPGYSGPFTVEEQAAALSAPPEIPALVKKSYDAKFKGVSAKHLGDLLTEITVRIVYVDPSLVGVNLTSRGLAELIHNMPPKDFARVPPSTIEGAEALQKITAADALLGFERLTDLTLAGKVKGPMHPRVAALIGARNGG